MSSPYVWFSAAARTVTPFLIAIPVGMIAGYYGLDTVFNTGGLFGVLGGLAGFIGGGAAAYKLQQGQACPLSGADVADEEQQPVMPAQQSVTRDELGNYSGPVNFQPSKSGVLANTVNDASALALFLRS